MSCKGYLKSHKLSKATVFFHVFSLLHVTFSLVPFCFSLVTILYNMMTNTNYNTYIYFKAVNEGVLLNSADQKESITENV